MIIGIDTHGNPTQDSPREALGLVARMVQPNGSYRKVVYCVGVAGSKTGALLREGATIVISDFGDGDLVRTGASAFNGAAQSIKICPGREPQR